MWSLAAFMGYMALLHARHMDWTSAFGAAAWSIAAIWLVVGTYLPETTGLSQGASPTSNLLSLRQSGGKSHGSGVLWSTISATQRPNGGPLRRTKRFLLAASALRWV